MVMFETEDDECILTPSESMSDGSNDEADSLIEQFYDASDIF